MIYASFKLGDYSVRVETQPDRIYKYLVIINNNGKITSEPFQYLSEAINEFAELIKQ